MINKNNISNKSLLKIYDKKISVLIVEDNEDDLELILYEIKKWDLNFSYKHVESKTDFIFEIKSHDYDIILADYFLTNFSGPEVIQIVKENNLNTPIIIVTGSINEEVAVEAIKSGASDYILKSKLIRLVPSINTALEKYNINKEKEKLKTELVLSKEMLSLILNSTEDSIILFDIDGKILYYNSVPILGLKTKDIIGKYPHDIYDDELADNIIDIILKVVEEKRTIYSEEDHKILHKVESFSIERSPLINDNGDVIAVASFARNITAKKKYEEALKKSEEKYKVIFNNASDSIIICDMNGKILDVNNICAEALQYKKNELIGRYLLDLISPIYYSYLTDKLATLKKEGSVTFELVHLSKNGKIIPIESRSKIINFNDQKAIISIIRDITERKKYEAELRAAKDKAEIADNLKSEFLAQMSHEIRTPINNILSFSSLIKDELDEKITNELNTSFDIISRAGTRIIRTIDLLLNMSEIQTGAYEYNPEVLDIYTNILEKLFIEFSIPASNKGIDIQLLKDTNTTKIFVDEKSTYQIFSNLIDNAIKYTHEGYVHIHVNCNSSGKLYVEIKDSGIGISKEFLSELFEPFTQEEQGYTRKYEGNGLGLALVKKYADLNSAEIEVESEKGKGSIFRITFSNN